MPDHITVWGDPQGWTINAAGTVFPAGTDMLRMPVQVFGSADPFGDTGVQDLRFVLPSDWNTYTGCRLIVTGTWTQSASGFAYFKLGQGSFAPPTVLKPYTAGSPIVADWVFDFGGGNGQGAALLCQPNNRILTGHTGSAFDIFYDPYTYVQSNPSSWHQSYTMNCIVHGEATYPYLSGPAAETCSFVCTSVRLQLWKTSDPGITDTICLGACTSVVVTPIAGAGTSGSWSITGGTSGSLGTSGTLNGWSVSYSGGVLTVCAPCGVTPQTITVTYEIDSGHYCTVTLQLIDCSQCGTGGGSGGSGPGAYGCIEAHGERAWLFASWDNRIRLFGIQGLEPFATSAATSVIDNWVHHRYDRRRSTLYSLGYQGSSGKFSVWVSTDGGQTVTEVIYNVANTAAIECQSERGRVVYLYGDSTDHVYWQESLDNGATWSTAVASNLGSSQLVAKLGDTTYDARSSTMFLTCVIGSTQHVLTSQDGGRSWVTAL